VRNGLARRGIIAQSFPDSRFAVAAPPGDPSSAGPTSTVADADRAALDQAIAEERRGDAKAAWNTAKGLFSAYPEVTEVQDLRCRLARARGLAWDDVRVECGPLMRLMMSGARNPLE
jgi:hypothetical protein